MLLLRTTTVTMPAIRVALWLLPFRQLRGALRRRARRPDRRPASRALTVDEVAWAVEVASRYVPRASCLVRALTLELLLLRSGREATLHVGVAKDQGELRAHSWVEAEGRRLLDDPDPLRFAPLLPRDRSRAPTSLGSNPASQDRVG